MSKRRRSQRKSGKKQNTKYVITKVEACLWSHPASWFLHIFNISSLCSLWDVSVSWQILEMQIPERLWVANLLSFPFRNTSSCACTSFNFPGIDLFQTKHSEILDRCHHFTKSLSASQSRPRVWTMLTCSLSPFHTSSQASLQLPVLETFILLIAA